MCQSPSVIRVWHVELNRAAGNVTRIRRLLISVASWPSISSRVVIYRPRCFVVPRFNTPRLARRDSRTGLVDVSF